MENIYTAPLEIRFSQCDHSGRLGAEQAFLLCMDLAGIHAARLGCGVGQLAERGLHWVAVKTLLRLRRAPALGELCTASTWPEAPGRVRNCRNYLLRAGDETLLAARTEWAVLDGTGRLQPVRPLYDPDMCFETARALEQPFHRFAGAFPDAPGAEYRVRSTDIDLAGHMNNAAYVRMLLGLYATAELDALRELEFHYRASSREGETLRLFRRETEAGTEYRAANAADETVLLARLTWEAAR